MTDTGDIELLEREPSLALLAGYAAEAKTIDHHVSALLAKPGAPEPHRRRPSRQAKPF